MIPATSQNDHELPAETMLLRDQYRIERPLVRGGFGITYLARDSLDRQVVIKECFHSDICYRDGTDVLVREPAMEKRFGTLLRQFEREARRLAALKHQNIVHVHQVFAENSSAYIAMEFVEGVDLMTVVEIEPERLLPDVLRNALKQTLEAIKFTHDAGILHGDIAPDNLMLGANNHITLIDFGAAYDKDGDAVDMHPKVLAVKDGYSPHEFYSREEKQDATSDLYSLGATFYHLITGDPPPDSQVRFAAVSSGKPDPYRPLAKGNWPCDLAVLETIDKALSVMHKDRIQSADEWIEGLETRVQEVAQIEHSALPTDVMHPDLTSAISQLVIDTNMKLKPAAQDAAEQERKKKEAERQRAQAERKQWVDIFGNPIEDVDAFLKEQERHRRGRHAESVEDFDAGSNRTGTRTKSSGRSVIGRLLNSVLSKKGASNSAVVQT